MIDLSLTKINGDWIVNSVDEPLSSVSSSVSTELGINLDRIKPYLEMVKFTKVVLNKNGFVVVTTTSSLTPRLEVNIVDGLVKSATIYIENRKYKSCTECRTIDEGRKALLHLQKEMLKFLIRHYVGYFI